MLDQVRLLFVGNAALASAFRQMLEENGASVLWERPVEERSVEAVTEQIVEMTVSGLAVVALQEACRKAYREFRRRFPGGGTVSSDDVEIDG